MKRRIYKKWLKRPLNKRLIWKFCKPFNAVPICRIPPKDDDEVWLDERLVQKFLDNGISLEEIHTNPIRMTLADALLWLEREHQLFVDVVYSLDEKDKVCITTRIRRIRFGEQVGATLLLEKRYSTPHGAKTGAVTWCLENIIGKER